MRHVELNSQFRALTAQPALNMQSVFIIQGSKWHEDLMEQTNKSGHVWTISFVTSGIFALTCCFDQEGQVGFETLKPWMLLKVVMSSKYKVLIVCVFLTRIILLFAAVQILLFIILPTKISLWIGELSLTSCFRAELRVVLFDQTSVDLNDGHDQ